MKWTQIAGSILAKYKVLAKDMGDKIHRPCSESNSTTVFAILISAEANVGFHQSELAELSLLSTELSLCTLWWRDESY